jgi:uncharacterized protein YqkB
MITAGCQRQNTTINLTHGGHRRLQNENNATGVVDTKWLINDLRPLTTQINNAIGPLYVM